MSTVIIILLLLLLFLPAHQIALRSVLELSLLTVPGLSGFCVCPRGGPVPGWEVSCQPLVPPKAQGVRSGEDEPPEWTGAIISGRQ